MKIQILFINKNLCVTETCGHTKLNLEIADLNTITKVPKLRVQVVAMNKSSKESRWIVGKGQREEQKLSELSAHLSRSGAFGFSLGFKALCPPEQPKNPEFLSGKKRSSGPNSAKGTSRRFREAMGSTVTSLQGRSQFSSAIYFGTRFGYDHAVILLQGGAGLSGNWIHQRYLIRPQA